MISVLLKKFFRSKKYNVIRIFTFSLLGFTGLFLLFLHHYPFNQLELNCQEIASWKKKPIDNWTFEEMLDYVKWANRSACSETHHFGGTTSKQIGVDGQKTVCLDETVRPERNYDMWPFSHQFNESTECLVYSFGINNEWSFDEAMEKFGCRVFSFDPSMKIGPHNHSDKIHFFDRGLNGYNRIWNSNETDKTGNWTMLSLDSIYRHLLRHNGRIIDYLKIDIENFEWTALPQIISSGMMDRVRQIGVEVHLFPSKIDGVLEEIRKRIKIMKSMEDYGLVRFDSQCNLWSTRTIIVDGIEWIGCTCYEIVWYNSNIARKFVLEENS